ncbi:MAG: nuclear transport factor 2 family protein [Actinomycetota bacterium]
MTNHHESTESTKGTELMLTTTLGERLASVASELESLAGHVDTVSPDPSTGNRAIVQRFLDAVEAGDLDAALDCCRPDVRYTIPGRGSASGDHLGPEAVRAALSARARTGGEVVQFLTHAVMGSGSPIVSYHEILASLDGQTARYRMLLLFGFTGGVIDEIHEFTDDQYVADDLFAAEPAAPAPIHRRRLPFRNRR